VKKISENKPKSNGNYFSIGEFSKICGVKKHTLFHYDEFELLKPVNIAKNGYREYSIGQIFNFELIGILKSFNMPLEEIKEQFKDENVNEIGRLLRSKHTHLDEEIFRLNRTKALIEQLSTLIERYASVPCGVPFIENRKSEHLILSEKQKKEEGELITIMTKHLQNCRDNNFGIKYPMGGILEYERLLSGDFRFPDYYFTLAAEGAKKEITVQKPAGFYAVVFHKGFYNTMGKTCEKLLNFVKEVGWNVVGDLYEIDLISNFKTKNRDEYIMELSIQIGEDKPI